MFAGEVGRVRTGERREKKKDRKDISHLDETLHSEPSCSSARSKLKTVHGSIMKKKRLSSV